MGGIPVQPFGPLQIVGPSAQVVAPVGADGLAGDEPRLGPTQEPDQRRHVVHLTEATQRGVGQVALPYRGVLLDHRHQLGANDPRIDR